MPQRREGDRQNNFFDTCRRCRNESSCCFGPRPPITADRRKMIEAYLKKQKIPIANAFVSAEYVFPRESAEGYCVFYNVEAAKCLIHPVKPEACVAGPITFDINKQSGKVEWYIKKEKICALAGIVYKDKQLLKKHLESAKREIFRLINGLNPEELEAILKKEEPETFKIGEDRIRRDGKA
jgi:Fe-S-cluster containining protein